MTQHNVDNQRAAQVRRMFPQEPTSWSAQPCADLPTLWKTLRHMAEHARRDGQHAEAKAYIRVMRLIAGGTP